MRIIIFDIISLDEGNLKILNRNQSNLDLRLVQIIRDTDSIQFLCLPSSLLRTIRKNHRLFISTLISKFTLVTDLPEHFSQNPKTMVQMQKL